MRSYLLDHSHRSCLSFLLKKLSVFLISSREDPYGLSCILVLPPTLLCVSLAPVLAPSLTSPLKSRNYPHQNPTSPQATLPTRLPRLSPLLHPLVGCGACASGCTPLV